MNPVVQVLGKVLRLVGISSPEDSRPQQESSGVPSWKKKAAEEAAARQAESSETSGKDLP